MKAVLKFNLPEDNFKHETACKADNMWLVLKNVLKIIEKDRDFYEKHNMDQGENALKSVHHQVYSEITNKGLDNLIFNY